MNLYGHGLWLWLKAEARVSLSLYASPDLIQACHAYIASIDVSDKKGRNFAAVSIITLVKHEYVEKAKAEAAVCV